MARPRARFARPAPKTKLWLGVDTGVVAVVASTDVQTAVLSAGALAFRPFTILRTRIELEWFSDQASVTENAIGAWAMGVVSENASTIGITAVPKPNTDADYNWVAWQTLFTRFQFLDSTGFSPDAATRYVVDSKSMRKVGANDDIIFVVENEAAVGAQIFQGGRVLIQLH